MSPEGIKALTDILVEKSRLYALSLKEFGALNPRDQVQHEPVLNKFVHWSARLKIGLLIQIQGAGILTPLCLCVTIPFLLDLNLDLEAPKDWKSDS